MSTMNARQWTPRSADDEHPAGPASRRRRGSSLVEVQVAFTILGIGLMGLCQLVVVQLRQVRVLEKRLQGQVVQTNASSGTSVTMLTGNTYYLVPWQSPLVQKLTGAAQISSAATISCDPGPLSRSVADPGERGRGRRVARQPERDGVCGRLRRVIGLVNGTADPYPLNRGPAMTPFARAAARRRAGMTLTEMVVASALASLLMVLLATTWANFGRPALEVEARARIEQEGILAAQSLACDFGGFLADTPGRTGIYVDNSLNAYQASTPPWNVSTPGVLILNFYGATTSDVIAITYQLEGNLLVRTNSSTGASTTVARYVTAFSAVANPENSSQVQIAITIAYRNFTSTFTLIGVAAT